MLLKKFLTKSRIIDVNSVDFKGVLAELLATIPDSILGKVSREEALQGLIERENAISTYLESGVCVPHLRIAGLKQKYIFAVGRCNHKVKIRENEEPKDLNTVFLLLSNDNVESYMETLSIFAKIFSVESDTAKKLQSALDIAHFRTAVLNLLKPQDAIQSEGKISARSKRKLASEEEKTNKLVITSAVKIAKVAKCSKIMLLCDTLRDFSELAVLLKSENVVVVTENPALQIPPAWQMINVRAFSTQRFSQIRSAIMIGITRKILGATDKVCCIGGVLGSNLVDSIIVFDIEKEFSNIFMGQKNILPEGVKPEVIERVIDIATELSVEGREGKPVGCIFVIGDLDEIKPHIKQLILNPFFGYKPEDRNILNPFMDETVKEYSLIDGAFIIDGNGILDSAGSLIHTPDFKLQLPGGLGARHAAAYSISLMANCVSVVVSSSTGQITLFRKGQMLTISERKRG